MRYLFILFLSFFCMGSFAQTTITPPAGAGDPMILKQSSSFRLINQNIFRAYDPVYEHKGSTLAADSGDYYKDEIGNEFFKADGNIVITQPSGTVIFADHLRYDASAQHAVLTNNVRMIDGNTTLTTNYLTYNTGKQNGTYRNGGRIVGNGDTITSKNAYYFELTKDAYFRNKVVVRTPSAIIYTDTLQYNTMYRDAFFFGPTNINGRNGEKLYTERGSYNTAFAIAKFNKNNLYTEGSRFLKGDSLFYDRDKGIGEAFRNVVFVDTLDKFYANGEYGKYLQADQSILMHSKPLIKYVVQQDSSADSTAVDSTQTADKSLSKKEQRKLEKEQEKAEKQQEKEQEKLAKLHKEQGLDENMIQNVDTVFAPPPKEKIKVDTAYMTADTIFSKVIFVKDYKPLDLKLNRDGGVIEDDQDVDYGDPEEIDLLSTGDSTQVDSINMQKPIVPNQEKKPISTTEVKKAPKPVAKPATAQKPTPVDPKQIQVTNKADSVLRRNAVMPTGMEQDSLMKKAITAAQAVDTTVKDSSQIYTDTARTRIVNAYNNVRVYKSDLQAVADSVYYGMVDSMFRFMGNPMIWSEGSQISADTIYMQILNNKMDNALLKDNAFMVNAVLDTLKFNQLKGRKITAFFANNNIDRLFVDGNAENLVFSTNDKTNKITEMFHDRSGRIRIQMEGKKIIDYVSIRKVDQKIYPFKLVSQENETLPGFVWKPEDRPKSVEDMMNRKRVKSSLVPDQEGKTPTEPNNQEQATEDDADKPEQKTNTAQPAPVKSTVKDTKLTKPADSTKNSSAPVLKPAQQLPVKEIKKVGN